MLGIVRVGMGRAAPAGGGSGFRVDVHCAPCCFALDRSVQRGGAPVTMLCTHVFGNIVRLFRSFSRAEKAHFRIL